MRLGVDLHVARGLTDGGSACVEASAGRGRCTGCGNGRHRKCQRCQQRCA
jgi:hypothetical protein